jgi:DnaA family protein
MIGAQLPLAVQLRESASFASYHAGGNAEAVAALQASTGPLLLYGPPGCGRTHLLQALCRERGAGYLPLAELRTLGPEVLDGFDAARGAALDDLDAVASELPWCVAVLRLIDALRARGALLALSAAAPPTRLAIALPDLHTRLQACASFGLRQLTDAERRALLQERALARGLTMPDEVARWLLNTRPRDVGSLLESLDVLDRASLSAKRRLTLPFAQQALARADARTAPG